MNHRRFAMLFAVTLLAFSSACSKSERSGPRVEETPLLVSTAASTKDVMESLAKSFAAQGGVEVKINSGPSNGLANQIVLGAPADLFLSANEQWAGEVEKAGLAESTVRLLTNQLVMVVPKENPGNVHQPSDLWSDKVKKIALAGENVPAGMYADQALAKLELLKPLIEQGKIVRGQDVRGALSFVERGEAEVGIVYSSDVLVGTGIASVYEFDPALHDKIVYVLVLLKHGSGNPASRSFFEFVQSTDADETYRSHGFSRLAADNNE